MWILAGVQKRRDLKFIKVWTGETEVDVPLQILISRNCDVCALIFANTVQVSENRVITEFF